MLQSDDDCACSLIRHYQSGFWLLFPHLLKKANREKDDLFYETIPSMDFSLGNFGKYIFKGNENL